MLKFLSYLYWTTLVAREQANGLRNRIEIVLMLLRDREVMEG